MKPHFPESEASRENTVGAFDKEPSSSSSGKLADGPFWLASFGQLRARAAIRWMRLTGLQMRYYVSSVKQIKAND